MFVCASTERLTKVMEQMKEEIVAATQHKPEGSLCSKLDILIKSVLGESIHCIAFS